jgi:hypothetical protein
MSIFNVHIFTTYCSEKSLCLDMARGILCTVAYKSRINDIRAFIVQNTWINASLKTYLYELIDRMCRPWDRLRRFVTRWRFHRRIVLNTTDMYLAPFADRDKFHYIANNTGHYKFRVNELQQIIRAAIENAHGLFSMPLIPKNPYTGHLLNFNALCSIYVSVQRYAQVHPSLFYFAKSDFNVNKFSIDYEAVLRDYHIKRTIRVMPQMDVIDELIQFGNHHIFQVSSETQRRWLHLYFVSMYSHNPTARTHARTVINNLI